MKTRTTLTPKAKEFIDMLTRLNLPEEKVEGMVALIQTDEQIDELMDWILQSKVELTDQWKKDLMAQAVTIATGR